MLELYRQGNRIVCPSRYVRGGRQLGGPWLKRTLSRLAGLSLHWLVALPTHDATNNFRLYDAELVQQLTIESTGGFEVALELTAKAFPRGVKIAEVPTTWKGSNRRHVPLPADEVAAEIPLLVLLRPDAPPPGDREGHDDCGRSKSRPMSRWKHSSTGSTGTVSRGRSWLDVRPSGGCSANPGSPATSPRGPAYWRSPPATVNSSTISRPTSGLRWI